MYTHSRRLAHYLYTHTKSRVGNPFFTFGGAGGPRLIPTYPQSALRASSESIPTDTHKPQHRSHPCIPTPLLIEILECSLWALEGHTPTPLDLHLGILVVGRQVLDPDDTYISSSPCAVCSNLATLTGSLVALTLRPWAVGGAIPAYSAADMRDRVQCMEWLRAAGRSAVPVARAR